MNTVFKTSRASRLSLAGSLLIIVLASFSSSIPIILGADLVQGQERGTGRTMYSDYWGRVPVREINPEDHITLLGTTLALNAGGTNVEMRFMIAIIARGSNDYPRDYHGSIGVQVRSSTNESSPTNLLADFDANVSLNPAANGNLPFHAIKHCGEMLDQSKALFVYEITFNIPLRKQVGVIPSYIWVVSSAYGELDIWRYTRREANPPATPVDSLLLGVPVPNIREKPAKMLSDPKPVQKPQAAAGQVQPILPEIRLDIRRENGFLVITCSPVVEGSVLEEVDLTASPWEWRPLQHGTNQSSQWYVPPGDGARAFRLRMP